MKTAARPLAAGQLCALRVLHLEAAQALIHIGVDLGRLRTLANLESGIEHALGALNLAIGPRGAGQASRSKLVATR